MAGGLQRGRQAPSASQLSRASAQLGLMGHRAGGCAGDPTPGTGSWEGQS